MSPEVIEITFKRNRKSYFFNSNDLDLRIGQYVIVEVEKGIDLGRITQTGRLVLLKDIKDEPKMVLRKASLNDLEKMKENRCEEALAFLTGKEYIRRRNLNMKLVDVEYQFDTNKLTFYFTSDQRVDFRELVKDLASKYRTRIELRQISVREEAKKLSGIGVCGKQLCCSSFMQDFSPISTNDAKEQNLPMNPSKLSGVCSRLKCCLLYEKGFYSASLERFPPLDMEIETERGIGIVDKVDIFNENVILRFNDEDYEQYTLKEINNYLPSSESFNIRD
jgi:cell fate regulator YaaT (PSP1 superfamily)